MEKFYAYLADLGFDPPLEVPPLGAGRVPAVTFQGGSPLYYTQLVIGERSIDDRQAAHNAYARYAFPAMLHASIDPDDKSFAHRHAASWVAIVYFVASFNGARPALKSDTETGKWVNALWDIRDACGKSFTDRMLFYALKSFDDEGGRHPQAVSKPFTEYFATRISTGEWVVDNQLSRLEIVNRILKEYGLLN